jgi:hypothetical protein
MARKASTKRDVPPGPGGGRRHRKVTYSLPEAVAGEVDRRCAGSAQRKSRLVAEALAFYFAAQDRRALAVLYTEAAQDPQFQADNESVQRDMSALDREMDRTLA